MADRTVPDGQRVTQRRAPETGSKMDPVFSAPHGAPPPPMAELSFCSPFCL